MGNKMTETEWVNNMQESIIDKWLPIAIKKFEKLVRFAIYNKVGKFELNDLFNWTNRPYEEDISYPITVDEKLKFINEFAEEAIWDFWQKSNKVRSSVIITYIITDVIYKTGLTPIGLIFSKFKISEDLLKDILFITSDQFNPTIFNWEYENYFIDRFNSQQYKTKVDWFDIYRYQKHIPIENWKPLIMISEKVEQQTRKEKDILEKKIQKELKYTEKSDILWSRKQLHNMEEFINLIFDEGFYF